MADHARSRVWPAVGAAVLLLVVGAAAFAAFGGSRSVPARTDLPSVVTARGTTAETTPAPATPTAQPSAVTSAPRTATARQTPRSSPAPAEPQRAQPARGAEPPSTSHDEGDNGKEIVSPPVREGSSPEGHD